MNKIKVATLGMIEYTQITEIPFSELSRNIKKHLINRIEQVLPHEPDLIVFPELCDFPAYYNDINSIKLLMDERKDEILQLLSGYSKANNCYIAYPSLFTGSDGKLTNSVKVIDRSGNVAGAYDKIYITCDEINDGIRPGSRTDLIKCDFGTIACAICFDLNFMDLLDIYKSKKPDIIIFPSMFHGNFLQKYWAYTARSYFVGAVSHTEGSIISPVGSILATSTNHFDYISADINLDCRVVHLSYNWEKLKELKKKYKDGVQIFDPGRIGSVLVSNEMDNCTIGDLLYEFSIDDLDSFFKNYSNKLNNHIESY